MEDNFEKHLHMLKITRVDGGGQWFGAEKDSGKPWPNLNMKDFLLEAPHVFGGAMDLILNGIYLHSLLVN